MVNTVFCKKGTKILEIFGETLVHAETYDKANKVDAEYYYLLGNEGKESDKNWDFKALHEHVMVDITKLKQKLDTLIFKNTKSLIKN